MAPLEIKTSVQIAASPPTIWKILTDFPAYKDWNPFLKSAEGDFIEGQKIKINADGMKFNPKVLVYQKNKEIRWIGKLLFTGLFDGEHSFVITDNGNGTSTFDHNEKFTGILVRFFKKKLKSEVKSGFEKMNEKLKELAEAAEISPLNIN